MSVRIQFDIEDEEYKKMESYIFNHKLRHSIAHQALIEWCNRKEGRDQKRRKEQLVADKKLLIPIIQEILENESWRFRNE